MNEILARVSGPVSEFYQRTESATVSDIASGGRVSELYQRARPAAIMSSPSQFQYLRSLGPKGGPKAGLFLPDRPPRTMSVRRRRKKT